MSKFFNSFKSQFGRDAGKVVSNLVFGNSHSTPHRNINSDNRVNLDKKKLDIQQKDLIQKDLYLLDGAVINAVNQVISIQIPNNEIEIIKIIQELEIQLKINKWLPTYKGQTAIIRNKYPDAVLTKYEHCLVELKFLNGNQERLLHASQRFSKYKKIRFFYKYQLFVILFFAFCTIWIITLTH